MPPHDTLAAPPNVDAKARGPRRDTVLVTGAGGFVGSAVVRALVDGVRGERPGGLEPTFPDGGPVRRVVAMLRPGGSTERLEELDASDVWVIERADITDPDALEALTWRARPRAIVHTALVPSAHGPLDEALQRERIQRPLEILFRALEDVPVSRIITTGSAAVLPVGRALDESAPTEPNPSYPTYARHKLMEERAGAGLADETGVSWTHLRLFYLFGRYEHPDRLLPYLVRNLAAGQPVELSSGRQVRDYTDVEEVADAYIRALGTGADTDGTYHVGSGRGISIREFAHTVVELVGEPSLLRFGVARTRDEGQEHIIADPARARRHLGWAASAHTDEKIREAVRWWLQRVASRSGP